MKILFVRIDGVGDLILTLPAAAQLKQEIPNIQLSYLVSRYAAPILERHPDVDEILCDPGPDSRARREMLSRGFDVVVFFKPYVNWFWSAYRAGVRRRIGTGFRWYSFLLSDRVYEHRSRFDKHESTYNINLLRPLGIRNESPVPPRLFLDLFEIEQAEAFLKDAPRPRVIIHPGNIYARNWKPERYLNLIKELRKLGYNMILTGNAEERKVIVRGEEDFLAGSAKPLNLMGCLDLRQFMAVISRCDLLISGSTGPMHLAAVLGVPTLSLFDPRRGSSPVRWGPLGKRGTVLKPDVPTCEKCIYEKCLYWDCMDRIGVESVVAHVEAIFSKRLTQGIKM